MIHSISKPTTRSKLDVSKVANKENEEEEMPTVKVIKDASTTEQKV